MMTILQQIDALKTEIAEKQAKLQFLQEALEKDSDAMLLKFLQENTARVGNYKVTLCPLHTYRDGREENNCYYSLDAVKTLKESAAIFGLGWRIPQESEMAEIYAMAELTGSVVLELYKAISTSDFWIECNGYLCLKAGYNYTRPSSSGIGYIFLIKDE